MPGATTSNWLFNKQMGYLLKGVAWTPPSTIYVGLLTTTPTVLDGTGITEVSTTGTNYARVAISSTGGWTGPTGTDQTYSNASDIVFPTPASGGTNWGTITGCALWTAASVGTGDLICLATLSSSKVVSSGDGAPKILAGQLKLSRSICPS